MQSGISTHDTRSVCKESICLTRQWTSAAFMPVPVPSLPSVAKSTDAGVWNRCGTDDANNKV